MQEQREKIKLLLKQQKISIQTLSNQSGIARSTLTKLLSGTIKSIKAEHLASIASVLGVSVAELMPTATTQNTTTIDTVDNNDGYVRVASTTVKLKPADTLGNAEQIFQRAVTLAQKGVKLIVFGELSITAYTCGDLFAQSTLLNGALDGLRYIIDKTSNLQSIIAVGLPYQYCGRVYNTCAIIFQGKLLALVPKTYLPNYNEFYEKRHFSPAFDGVKFVTFDGQQVPFGTDILFSVQGNLNYTFACEICEDLWVATPPSLRHALNGADIIINLSASNETIGKADFRCNLVKMQSVKCAVGYIYASNGEGESTADLLFSGHNIIAENGKILSQTQLFTCQSAIADIDIDYIRYERTKSFNALDHINNGSYHTVNIALNTPTLTLTRKYSKQPFVPSVDIDKRMSLILQIQANALKQRIEHTHSQKLVIGVSGGLDSSLALIVCCKALNLLNRPNSDIIAVTMPCFGTTERTLNNSIALAKSLNTTIKIIDITPAVKQHFKDIEHSETLTDVTYENSQARERTQILMDIANQANGIVIGTGDLSELALGWATYNGDHMSMYAVNCSVPKTLIRHLISYVARVEMPSIAPTLTDIINTPVSPELLPDNNGEIAQKTEDIVGPYELHDFFLYHTIHNGFSPKKILRIAQMTFSEYDTATIKKWLVVFVKRFFAQQFKRNCVPDGIKIGSVALSPRGDWRMPSDAVAKLWLSQLD